MSAEPVAADIPLTTAQRRKNTIAKREEEARQEQKIREAELKGGRQAKADAKENAIWKVDQPSSRKRTSSTVQASEKVKKPRESVTVAQSDAEDTVKAATKTKVKVSSSSKRKYAAPTIALDSDESDAAAPAKLPKSKAVGKVKQVMKKALKAIALTKSSKAAKSKASVKPLVEAKIVAESASDAEDDSADEHSNKDKDSDSDLADFEDANEAEFIAEASVPRVISKKRAPPAADSDNDSDGSMVKEDADPKQLFDSDQESIEIDKPRTLRKDKHRKVEPSDDEMPDAPARRAHDEDIMMHEAIADALVPIPLSHRSRRSSAASWSSGQDLHVPETDLDDEDDAIASVPKPRTVKEKSRKVSAYRQQLADLEKPEVRAAPVPNVAHRVKLEPGETNATPARSEDSWHPSARIAYPAPGKKDVLLNAQTEELQLVLRHAISAVKSSLVFEDAYPPILSRAGFARAYLIEAADAIPEGQHIRERLGSDLKYAAVLADILHNIQLLDRINILRGDIKRTAAGLAPGFFQFAGLNEVKTKELIEKVLKDHRYIFPTDPQTQRLMTEKPFHHPALRAVIKNGVFTRNFKANNMHLFISTSKKHPKQLELPDAMVALAATALYAALLEYRTTGEHQTIAFTEGAYEDTYRNHMNTLSQTRASAPVALHKVLHGLFNEVTDGKSTQPEAGSSATLINLVEVPESD
ncbi:hypothetical protein C8R43DRAFT_1136736 [Mycena crocata]|nr:hypothetical protein C8R43DRAFT_1136736 [Mycena crocata]